MVPASETVRTVNMVGFPANGGISAHNPKVGAARRAACDADHGQGRSAAAWAALAFSRQMCIRHRFAAVLRSSCPRLRAPVSGLISRIDG